MAWRSHPRPTGEGHLHLPGASGPPSRRWINAVPGGSFCSAEPPAEPALACPLPVSIPSSVTGLVRTGVLKRRRRCWRGPAVSGSGKNAGVFPSPSFWPADTVPARQNSPPPVGQGSVSPGHPCVTEGEVSVARRERVGKKLADFWVGRVGTLGGKRTLGAMPTTGGPADNAALKSCCGELCSSSYVALSVRRTG